MVDKAWIFGKFQKSNSEIVKAESWVAFSRFLIHCPFAAGNRLLIIEKARVLEPGPAGPTELVHDCQALTGIPASPGWIITP